MGEVNLPLSLVDDIREMKREIRDLQRQPLLRNVSMRDGTVTITDADSNPRVIMGLLDDGDYGIEVRTAAGLAVFKAENAGLVLPRQPLMITKRNESVPVTSATFVPVWAMVTPYATADAVQVQALVTGDAATTGEVRLSINVGGTTYAAVQTIPASSSAYYEWKWAVPGLVVGTGPIQVVLEARRTGGAGNINAYPPVQAHNTTAASIGATPTGV